jgi:hypothetical protein
MSRFRDNLVGEAARVALPSWLEDVMVDLPANVDRRRGADLITRHLFPVSYRTLEAWPLPTRHVNGRAIISTRQLFEIAFAKLNTAPILMGGRCTVTEHPS